MSRYGSKKSTHEQLVDLVNRTKKDLLLEVMLNKYDNNEESLLNDLNSIVKNSFDYQYNILLSQEKKLREDINDFELHYCYIHSITKDKLLDVITPESAEEYNAMLRKLDDIIRREDYLRKIFNKN